MIKEDYVSFEVAKLLKENGFDSDKCIALYDLGNNNELVIDTAIYDYGAEDYLQYTYGDEWQRFGYYLAPTLQMAMKWLREVHNIFICIIPSEVGAGVMDYTYVLYRVDAKNFYFEDLGIQGRAENVSEITPEKVCEEAIKYCMENLI